MYTVLIVDDMVILAMVIDELVKSSGNKSIVAHSGEECLECLRKEKPDMILLDLIMKPMDGWETLGKIRENPDTGNIPVIMLTAKVPSPDEILRHIDSIDGYLMKPVLFDRINSEIVKMLEFRRSVGEIVSGAEDGGSDAELLSEYTTLAISLKGMEGLIEQLNEIYQMNVPDPRVSAEYSSIIMEIENAITDKDRRFSEVKSELNLF